LVVVNVLCGWHVQESSLSKLVLLRGVVANSLMERMGLQNRDADATLLAGKGA
jgi:hypothetical protein